MTFFGRKKNLQWTLHRRQNTVSPYNHVKASARGTLKTKNTLNTACHAWNVINLATDCNSVGHDEVWVTSGNRDKTLSTKGYKFRKYIPTQQHTKIEPRTQHCFTMRLWQEKRFRFSSRWTHTYGNQELLKCNQSFCIYLLIESSKNDQK